jgi:LmbE family N-acetylglucosaminyl deacetylase
LTTLVCFHAHPDDESIATGGVMAMAANAGHRVVLVLATRGEEGEVAEGFLRDGESLGDRRVEETERSAAILGVQAVEWLGYRDSGMMGTPTNDEPSCFWRADVEEAASKLAGILASYDTDVLTIYDSNGSYGHPDHIKVHRVGVRAAEIAGVREVFEATMNRDHIVRNMREAIEAAGDDIPGDLPDPSSEDFNLGVPETSITTAVDVTAYLDRKRASMRAHASQIQEQSFFLAMPDDAFARGFGVEWFIHRGVEPKQPWETSII